MSGLLFIFTAVTFLLGWLLMPDAGTNDAAHILQAVAATRTRVLWSVIVHLSCGLALLGAVAALQSSLKAGCSRRSRCGAWLVLVGAVGICMDAFFHLVAFYLTAPGVEGPGVLEAMRLLQSQGILFLIPLLLPIFFGGALFTTGLSREKLVSAWPSRTFILALLVALCGGVIAGLSRHGRQEVVLTLLLLTSCGYGLLGYELMRLGVRRADRAICEAVNPARAGGDCNSPAS